jgi:hypothetical protein
MQTNPLRVGPVPLGLELRDQTGGRDREILGATFDGGAA